MIKKGTRIHNKVRKIRIETLNKLYFNMPTECQECCYNASCTEMEYNTNELEVCVNYKKAIQINELIEMMKKANICIDSFCTKYNLKKDYFLEAMKGHRLLSYKEYYYLCKRLRVEEYDEFYIYNERFEIKDIESQEIENEFETELFKYENKTLKSEVQI